MKRVTVKLVLAGVLALLPVSAAQAQSELGLMGIGGRLGFVDASGIDGTILLEAMADLGNIAPNLALEVRVGIWSKSTTVTNVFGTQVTTGEGSVRDFMLGGALHYEFDTSNEKIQPYAGGGLSIHFFRTKADIRSEGPINVDTSSSVTNSELGIDLIGGVLYKMNEKISLNGGLSYTLGDAEQLALKVGALISLGN